MKETVLDGPALCFTNHKANGETILRRKSGKRAGDIHAMWNYGKLSYNTKYPWESTPTDSLGIVPKGEVEAQQYVLKDVTTGNLQKGNVTFWHGQKDGILYRRQFFDYDLKEESMWIQAVNLADFPVANGIIRVDKHRLFKRPVIFTLVLKILLILEARGQIRF